MNELTNFHNDVRQILEIATRQFHVKFSKKSILYTVCRELRRICQFYLCFPIRDTVRPELSWSYYRLFSKQLFALKDQEKTIFKIEKEKLLIAEVA